MPRQSFAAFFSICLHPRYLSLVCTLKLDAKRAAVGFDEAEGRSLLLSFSTCLDWRLTTGEFPGYNTGGNTEGLERRTPTATPTDTMAASMTLEVPEHYKLQWLKEVFEFTDTEMAYVLGISVETLRKWQKDENDAQATESVRFHRLLNLSQLAKGVIRPGRLGHWVHHENQALGRLLPLSLLADAAGYGMVNAVVEDLRTGISD
jgi:hypothetical protein